MAQPLVAAGLARMPAAEQTLAAWPIVWGVLFMSRSPALALPEAVIALVTERRLLGPVRAFCLRVGVACGLALVLLGATPLADLYLRHAAGLPEHLARLVVPGTCSACCCPP